jgi:aminopeptidase N
MSYKRVVAILIIIFSISLAAAQEKEDKTLLLRIGDKRLKDKTIDVSPGIIYSAEEGRPIPFLKMIKEMKGSRFVYIGETHNSLSMHDLQLRIIQALHEQDRNLSIGLEMFPSTSQEVLNKWSLGLLNRDEFLRESRWYVNWNYNFGFYEKIFEFAKNNKIPMCALNAPSEIITKIRRQGWDALSDDEKSIVPQPDLSHEEHRVLIRSIFEESEIPPQMKGASLDMAFEGLYRAQSAWDEVMAFNALKAVQSSGQKMAVLAGSGHLLYNLGINRRAYEKNRLPFKTVIFVAVPESKSSVQIASSLADYVFGLKEEEMPAFPSVGLRLKTFEGLDNLVIESKPVEGVAEKANFEKGDIILSVDEQRFLDINELRIYLARFKWNDEVKFNLLRNAQKIDVILKFQPPEKKKE